MQQTADDLFLEVPEVELRVQLGDVTELTLGENSGNSEDKRYQYN
ncbi:MAG: albusnodin family lasso peptide [Pseudonocardiaceae bacterium]